MAALVCEICGGKLIGKPGGLFECEFCGVEYDTSWAKAKIQEIKGTVKVEGTVQVTGTVAVDTGKSKENLLKRIKIFANDRDFKKIKELVDEVLNLDPECGDAYLWQLLATFGVENLDKLFDCDLSRLQQIKKNPTWQKVMQYCDPETAAMLEQRFTDRQHYWTCESPELKEHWRKIQPVQNLMFYNPGGVFCLKADGTVLVSHDAENSWLDALANWNGVKKLVATHSFVLGLRWDGTVLLTSKHAETRAQLRYICERTDIRDIAVKSDLAVALTESGDLLAPEKDVEVIVSSAWHYCCSASGWTDVETIEICHSIASKETLWFGTNLSTAQWCHFVLGLTKDGRIRCSDFKNPVIAKHLTAKTFESHQNVEKIGDGCSLLLKDGKICHHGSISSKTYLDFDIEEKGICRDTSFGRGIVVKSDNYALRADGRVVTTKNSYHRGVNPDVELWTGIVAFADCFSGALQLGLREDGTVLHTWNGKPIEGFCFENWKLFNSLDTFEKERQHTQQQGLAVAEERRRRQEEEHRKQEEEHKKQQELQKTMYQRRQFGLCQHCGGELKGFFSKKCVSCGKPKDY